MNKIARPVRSGIYAPRLGSWLLLAANAFMTPLSGAQPMKPPQVLQEATEKARQIEAVDGQCTERQGARRRSLRTAAADRSEKGLPVRGCF